MSEQVPFQIVTRAARRRALQAAEAAQVATGNNLTANAPTAAASSANASAANASAVNTSTANVSTVNISNANISAASALTANAPTVNVPTLVVPTVTVTAPAPPSTGIVDTPQSIEREAVEGQANEAGEMMEWMEANAPEAITDAPPQQYMLTDRCTSPLCPVPTTIPHDIGLYLHDGELNNRPERHSFGLSNPPPEVWRAIDRVYNGTQQPGDQAAIDAFDRNHNFLEEPFLEEDDELVTVT